MGIDSSKLHLLQQTDTHISRSLALHSPTRGADRCVGPYSKPCCIKLHMSRRGKGVRLYTRGQSEVLRRQEPSARVSILNAAAIPCLAPFVFLSHRLSLSLARSRDFSSSPCPASRSLALLRSLSLSHTNRNTSGIKARRALVWVEAV